ncbi:MAG: restriction endonuclease [Salinarimonadaceae bacterium]|nr:MAG: restriction endonuclease [Salinarimonadaceae bacterium]
MPREEIILFPELSSRNFQIKFVSHAKAILGIDFPEAEKELESALQTLSIPIHEVVGSGGGEAKITQRLRRSLAEQNWNKKNFEIEKMINGVKKESISHEIDHVREFIDRGTIALEIEWNNKDPFFDRDLENFKRLHAEGAISVGIIITRGESMQNRIREMVRRFAAEQQLETIDQLIEIGLNPTKRQQDDYTRRMRQGDTSFAEAWSSSFVADKYGAATTHWRKLEDRVRRGVGNPCPLVLIGLPAEVVTFD